VSGQPPDDYLAMAWSDNMYIQSTGKTGSYKTCPSGLTGPSALNIDVSEITPKVGIEYAFEDQSWCKDSFNVYIGNSWNIAVGNGYIRENSWHNDTANIASKFVHTYGSGTVSITLGPIPSITIGGTMTSKWSVALSLAFTH
jgi:hypothetical protein